jgi:hypothetical protein
MAVGDNVIIGAGSVRSNYSGNVPVYDLKRQENGDIYFAPNGIAYADVKGGVTGGCTGKIHGNPVKVFTTTLAGEKTGSSFGALDTVLLYPVFLNKYQKVGWFPSDHMHIV